MSEVSKNIVTVITEEPIVFEVALRLSFFKEVLAKVGLASRVRRFSIRPATLEVIHGMNEYLENVNVGEVTSISEAFGEVDSNSMDTCRFLAVAIERTPDRKKVDKLATFLYKNITAKGLSTLKDVVIKQSDVAFFLSTMVLVARKPREESSEKLTAPLGPLPEV